MIKIDSDTESSFPTGQSMVRFGNPVVEKIFLFVAMLFLMPFMIVWIVLISLPPQAKRKFGQGMAHVNRNDKPALIPALSIYMTDRFLQLQ